MKELKHKYIKLDCPDRAEWTRFVGDAQNMIQTIEDLIKNNKGAFAEEEIAELRSLSNQIGDTLDDLSYLNTKIRVDGTGLKWRSV